MDKVSVELKHCYGIKALKHEFAFTKTRAYAIYAPNGVMKSSLAQTFQDVVSGTDSKDRIFAERKTTRKITDDTGNNVSADQILVVLPYDPEFGVNEKTSTLLVDAKLRQEYEKLHIDIDTAKDALLRAVQKQADSKANFEDVISSAFTRGDDFQIATTRIKDELANQKDAPFATVKYDAIFDPKVVAALEKKGLKDAIEEYIKRYNKLLAASTYFKKGTFDYYNAGQIAKSLADNGFFDAKHTVNLKSLGKVVEINTQKELENIIASEKEAILKDKELRKNFDSVAKELNRNAELREFCKYLQVNEALLSRMNNLDKFKEDLIKSYLKANYDLYKDLMSKYAVAAEKIKKIQEEAAKQRTQWEEVIAIFNDRFFVPFELEARK